MTALAPSSALTDRFLPDRSRPVYLINEDLARAHMRERLREAERYRRAARLRAARRATRRAEQSGRRARRALALLDG